PPRDILGEPTADDAVRTASGSGTELLIKSASKSDSEARRLARCRRARVLTAPKAKSGFSSMPCATRPARYQAHISHAAKASGQSGPIQRAWRAAASYS